MSCAPAGGDKLPSFDIGDRTFNPSISDANCCALPAFGVLAPCELGDKGALFIPGLPALLGSVEAFDPPESTLLRRYGSAGEASTPAPASGSIATSDGLSVRTSERGANASVCFVRGDLGEWGDRGERSCFAGIAEEEGRDRLETMACVMGGAMGTVSRRLYDMSVAD